MQRLCSAATSHTGRSAPNRLNFLFYVRQGRLFNLPLARGAAVEVGHNLPVGVPLASGVSPDESQLAYLEKAETPGATEGWRVAVVRIADGSRVESWPVHSRHIIRRCSDGRTMVSRGNSCGPTATSSKTARRRRIEATNQVHLRRIFTFQWSRDGRLVMTRGSVSRDVVQELEKRNPVEEFAHACTDMHDPQHAVRGCREVV